MPGTRQLRVERRPRRADKTSGSGSRSKGRASHQQSRMPSTRFLKGSGGQTGAMRPPALGWGRACRTSRNSFHRSKPGSPPWLRRGPPRHRRSKIRSPSRRQLNRSFAARAQQLIQNQENAYQQQVAGVTLNSDLQHLADIINDTSGTYSQADKVAAYTKEYDTFAGSDLATHSSPANADQRVQHVKFDTVIADSEIGQAVIDGKQKYAALQQSQTWYDPNWETKFYASLSGLQKQLPEFVVYGPDAAFRSQIKDEITLSSSAQSLFRGTATTAQEATAEQEAAQITAQLPQAYKAALDNTTLSPELQRLVTIINNVGGQYSAQDQVNAYTEATNTLGNLPKTPQQIGEDPFGIIGGVSFAANLHYEKFSQMIQGSAVVAAENDGIQKAHDAVAARRGFFDTSSPAQIFSTLTPMEQLLPRFKDLDTAFSKLLQEGAAKTMAIRNEAPSLFTQQQSAAALEAEILFSAVPQNSDTARSNSASTTRGLSIIA